jgi:hemoglobin
VTRGDIRTPQDVAVLVDAFYSRVFVDPLIGPEFTDLAQVDMRRRKRNALRSA